MALKAGQKVTPRPTVSASFKTPFIQSLWDILAQAEAAGDSASDDAESPAATSESAAVDSATASEKTATGNEVFVIALPAEDSPDQRYIALRAVNRQTHVAYRLQVIPKPDGTPPLDIAAQSSQLSGVSGLLDVLDKQLAAEQPLISQFSISFNLPKSQYDCPSIISSPAIGNSELASKLTVNGIGFKFADGILGLRNTFIGEQSEDAYSVFCDSKSTLSFLGYDLFSYADSVRALIKKSLFRQKDATHVAD
jgi:hypothetical protein